MADNNPRYNFLRQLSGTLPVQGSQEWLDVRKWCVNSSEYDRYEGRYGDRSSFLSRSAKGEPEQQNIAMSWGNLAEDASGYCFTATTGLRYELIGSHYHKSNPKIRGSLDGFGLDKDKKLFVLETKSHYSKEPTSCIGNVGYGKQVVQNIEIADADYGLFNATRLLPAATKDIGDRVSGRTLESSSPIACEFHRFNLAAALPKPIHLVAISVHRSPRVDSTSWEERFGAGQVWLGNIFDGIVGTHPVLKLLDLRNMITAREFIWKPMEVTNLIGPDANVWAEKMVMDGKKLWSEDSSCIGVGFLKLSSHNIQSVPRQTEYWETYMHPVAEQWLADIELARRGEIVPARLPMTNIPPPIGVFPSE